MSIVIQCINLYGEPRHNITSHVTLITRAVESSVFFFTFWFFFNSSMFIYLLVFKLIFLRQIYNVKIQQKIGVELVTALQTEMCLRDNKKLFTPHLTPNLTPS